MTVYDGSSGQVYTETVSAMAESMTSVWATHTNRRRIDPSQYRSNGIGSSLLRDMAMRSCLWHINCLEPEALEDLGWHYASQIYKQLKDTDRLSFATWCKFQQVYAKHLDHHHAFRFYGTELGMSRSFYLSPMINRFAKLDSNVLFFLCLQNLHINTDHLFSLIKIPTLAALVIDTGIDGSCASISAKNLRDWGRAVRETAAFERLKLLILNGLVLDPTTILYTTQAFPALIFLAFSIHYSPHQKTEVPQSHKDPWVSASSSLPLNGAAQTAQEIWNDYKEVTIVRIQMLYDLSQTVSHAPCPAAETSRISLAYGAPFQRPGRTSHWFVHTRAEAPTPLKRTIEQVSPRPEGVDARSRKVRGAKQADIGSLLSAFQKCD